MSKTSTRLLRSAVDDIQLMRVLIQIEAFNTSRQDYRSADCSVLTAAAASNSAPDAPATAFALCSGDNSRSSVPQNPTASFPSLVNFWMLSPRAAPDNQTFAAFIDAQSRAPIAAPASPLSRAPASPSHIPDHPSSSKDCPACRTPKSPAPQCSNHCAAAYAPRPIHTAVMSRGRLITQNVIVFVDHHRRHALHHPLIRQRQLRPRRIYFIRRAHSARGAHQRLEKQQIRTDHPVTAPCAAEPTSFTYF